MTAPPNVRDSVSVSPRNTVDANNPVTGTPSMAFDILAEERCLLAALMATNEKAVANGPMYNITHQNVALKSPVKLPSK
tara:strand:- start:180 stop:416 length:237 start_codon:yes stop_codon:yes gene_type:complete